MVGPRITRIGLSPRKAANSSPTGGRCAMRVASEDGTPADLKPEYRCDGSDAARPRTMRLKNTVAK
jgi:hypothetical protein